MKGSTSNTPAKEKDCAQTPMWFIRSLESLLGVQFELDVCANESTAKCSEYYSLDERGQDSLILPWSKSNWCNPPFSGGNIIDFIDKASEEAACAGNSTAIIMPASIETKYIRLATERADTVIKMPFRLEYLRPDGTSFTDKNGKRQGPQFPSVVAWITPLGLKCNTREFYHDFRVGFK